MFVSGWLYYYGRIPCMDGEQCSLWRLPRFTESGECRSITSSVEQGGENLHGFFLAYLVWKTGKSGHAETLGTKLSRSRQEKILSSKHFNVSQDFDIFCNKMYIFDGKGKKKIFTWVWMEFWFVKLVFYPHHCKILLICFFLWLYSEHFCFQPWVSWKE